MKKAISISIVCSILILTGCGDSRSIAPVSGRVTLDGKPLAECQIRFQPVAVSEKNINPGSGSYAVTDVDGCFTLKAINPTRAGALVGKHKVWLSTARPENLLGSEIARLTAEKVPPKYRNGELEFEVPLEGTDSANFELSSR